MAGQPSEHRVTLPDSTPLFYRAWLPARVPRGWLVLLHRGHEHSGRFGDVVEALGLRDVAVFAWDARGHGQSPGPRGYAPGFGAVVRDLDGFVRHLAHVHGLPPRDTVVLGHSIGAVIAAAWVHDYAPRIRALVLVTPAFRVKLYVPLAVPGLRLRRALRKGRPAFVQSYVRGRLLTHDPHQARAYDRDPLIARAVAVDVLLGLHDTAARLVADATAIRIPTLLLAAGRDWVVARRPQARFFRRLGSPVKEMVVFPGLHHDLLHEAHREPVLERIRRFARAAWQEDGGLPPLLDADRAGYTREEHDRLSRPLRSPRALPFAVLGAALRSLGRLSDGIQLGWRSGFDSGRSLDYVYQDRAAGRLLIGRWVDRLYLDSPGWRGVRVRRAHLQALLAETVDRLFEAGRRPVRVVDLAAGGGRYVLEVAAARPGRVAVHLRDLEAANVEAARARTRRLGLRDVTVEQADALDEASVAGLTPAPDVAVVSGLYELFADNGPVRRSLQGLAKALGGGGYLLYTGQPWHPQLEMIARVLRNREGRPWVMRRRTQEELDDLVRAAGFEKVETRIDDGGLFTVSLARIGDPR